MYQYFVVFCPAWDNFSFENILYAIAWYQVKNVKEKVTTKPSLKTTEVLLVADGHVFT